MCGTIGPVHGARRCSLPGRQQGRHQTASRAGAQRRGVRTQPDRFAEPYTAHQHRRPATAQRRFSPTRFIRRHEPLVPALDASAAADKHYSLGVKFNMSHNRADQITVSGEWARHLRPYGKRAFWKAERRAYGEHASKEAASEQPEYDLQPMPT